MTGRVAFKHHRRSWTEDERDTLKTLYPYMGTAKVAHVMLRSMEAIASEACRLKLKKDPAFYKRPVTERGSKSTTRILIQNQTP